MKFWIILILITASHAGANSQLPSIQVMGRCERRVIPDKGSISFTSENQFKDQKKAVEKTTEQINKLKTLLKDLKLKDMELKNSSYTVSPVSEWEKEKSVFKGYRAGLTLELITSDISRIGEAISAASKAEITRVGELATYLSIEKSHKEYLNCLAIAADDARSKAEELSKKLQFKIGEVIFITENPATTTPPPFEKLMKGTNASLSDRSSSTQIEAGTIVFNADIQVTFKIK